MEDKFPDRLRELRRARGVSCQVMAECCGLSKNAIRRYERGQREPGAQSVIKIARYFEVTTDYLLGVEKKF